ncbi:MAG: cell division protein FtsZ [Candidatus Adiutrix sp.]|jgi:cell division protein FtsZ|nr:cell division protein FtsZ [Candidatus Adiutrix sp.]
MMMEFSFQDTKVLHKIKVFGIGGGGNNAINNMILAGVTGPLFVAANSDMQDLERNLAPHKVQVGSQLTKGLGCGGKAEVGRAAAQEDLDRIKDMLADSDMVFITAGMGGGTGSGGAPVVAEALSKCPNPPLVVGVVTKPFSFEGPRRMKQATEAIEELTKYCDCILVVPNEKLMATMPKGCTLQEAFHEADTVLLKAVQGITDLITGKGLVNVDFQDLKTVMTKRGPTIMGVGQASGEDRALKAAQQAVSSPLLDDLTIDGAQGVLINITGPSDLGLEEVSTVCSLVTREAHPDAEIFHGVTFDENLAQDGLIKVTVIATGLGAIKEKKEENLPEAPQAAPAQPQAMPRAAQPAAPREEVPPQAVTPPPQPRPRPAPEVMAGQQQPSGVIDYTPHQPQARGREERVERGPARPAARTPATRRNRLAQRYESIQIDGDNFDIPTYLRHSAD